MEIDKAKALSYLCEQHLRLRRSRHVELVLAEANAEDDASLLQRQDAVYNKYLPLLRQMEAEHRAIANDTTE